LFSDTVPGKDNYIIEVIVREKKGSPTIVVVKDKKSKKEIKRMTLEEWDKNKKNYEMLYGPVEGIVEDENHPGLITTDGGRNVYTLRSDAYDTVKFKLLELDNNHQVKLTFDDGRTENYNLNDEDEKREFEKKYGEVLFSGAPAKAVAATTISPNAALASPSKVYESSTVSVSTGSTAFSPGTLVGTPKLAGPASIATTAGPVTEVITEDKIIAVFKKDMQEADVKKLEADLRDKGYDFKITKAEYNNSGRLILVKGHITKHNHKQYFNASNFSRLIITDSPDNNDDDHFNFLVEQGRLNVNDTPEWQ
jgi:hypothetical protein